MSRYILAPTADRDAYTAWNGGLPNAERVLMKFLDVFDLIARWPGFG